jgi:hypothetical protein
VRFPKQDKEPCGIRVKIDTYAIDFIYIRNLQSHWKLRSNTFIGTPRRMVSVLLSMGDAKFNAIMGHVLENDLIAVVDGLT